MLQLLLDPVQSLAPEDVPEEKLPSRECRVPSLDETLQWEKNGRPSWWPAAAGDRVLLRNLREQLPPVFPDRPRNYEQRRAVVRALHRVHIGLAIGAAGILNDE